MITNLWTKLVVLGSTFTYKVKHVGWEGGIVYTLTLLHHSKQFSPQPNSVLPLKFPVENFGFKFGGDERGFLFSLLLPILWWPPFGWPLGGSCQFPPPLNVPFEQCLHQYETLFLRGALGENCGCRLPRDKPLIV